MDYAVHGSSRCDSVLCSWKYVPRRGRRACRHGRLVRVMINPFNHLPDAVETVAVFYDHCYQWGDVRQRIYWDNWQTEHGLRYPTNEVEERNGILWESRQVLKVNLSPWNATVVKQDDGIVLLESPLSGTYMAGVIDKAKEQSPGQPLKEVLSTSDSWPHVGGVRQVVAWAQVTALVEKALN
jgi:hypothetical protein